MILVTVSYLTTKNYFALMTQVVVVKIIISPPTVKACYRDLIDSIEC
jgi:hypothetical protein